MALELVAVAVGNWKQRRRRRGFWVDGQGEMRQKVRGTARHRGADIVADGDT